MVRGAWRWPRSSGGEASKLVGQLPGVAEGAGVGSPHGTGVTGRRRPTLPAGKGHLWRRRTASAASSANAAHEAAAHALSCRTVRAPIDARNAMHAATMTPCALGLYVSPRKSVTGCVERGPVGRGRNERQCEIRCSQVCWRRRLLPTSVLAGRRGWSVNACAKLSNVKQGRLMLGMRGARGANVG